MKLRARRILAVGILAAIGILGFGSAAFARTHDGPIEVQNPYVRFEGTIHWYPNGVNYGGMQVYGYLYNTAGGNYAKIQGKVAGYSYATLWQTDDSTGGFYGNYVVYDYQATQVDFGWVNVCHHNVWSADNCSSEYNTR